MGIVVPIPDYQTLMSPVLELLADGKSRTVRELRDQVSIRLGLSEDELRERIGSGTSRFDNRVQWTITYLYQAGLLQRPSRGVVKITPRGKQVLSANPDRVDNKVLDQFEEFRAFKARGKERHPTVVATDDQADAPPHEKIADAVEEANNAVATQILERIQRSGSSFLERLVLRVLEAMGYGGPAGSIRHVGGPGDGGVDGVIRQDSLGLDEIYVQAKAFAPHRTVGRPDIQAFVGALHGAQADRGVFITTSRFSSEAREYAERVNARLVLIDGPQLAELMVRHNVGAQDLERFVLKRIDEDFFETT